MIVRYFAQHMLAVTLGIVAVVIAVIGQVIVYSAILPQLDSYSSPLLTLFVLQIIVTPLVAFLASLLMVTILRIVSGQFNWGLGLIASLVTFVILTIGTQPNITSFLTSLIGLSLGWSVIPITTMIRKSRKSKRTESMGSD